MRTLQVKKVPEELKARLVRQARARGLSLSEFVLEALERALDEAEWRERLAQRAPVDLGLPAFALRDRLPAHEALYVALAQRLSAPILTADGPLARAPGLPVPLIHLRL